MKTLEGMKIQNNIEFKKFLPTNEQLRSVTDYLNNWESVNQQLRSQIGDGANDRNVALEKARRVNDALGFDLAYVPEKKSMLGKWGSQYRVLFRSPAQIKTEYLEKQLDQAA